MGFGKTHLFKIVGFILIMIMVVSSAQEEEIYISHHCSTSNNYTSCSTYRKNLNSVLTDLSLNTNITYGYHNLSAGQSPNKVIVSALCRGDISLTACRNCLRYSTSEILTLCPAQKEAIVWYSHCSLRYSNRSLFGYSKHPIYVINGTRNFTIIPSFSEQLDILLNRLTGEASSGDSTRKFAVGFRNSTDTVRTYALVQCTPDLSKLDCGNCLNYLFGYISTFAPGSTTGSGYCPSCNFRYQLRQFYEDAEDEPLVLSPTYMVAPRIGNERNGTRNVLIGVFSFVCVVIIIACLFMISRKRKQRNYIGNEDIEKIQCLEFDFETIKVATRDFSVKNKIGRGGFGNVYKGRLASGQEIAVKRLEASSGQGDLEFKNEVILTAEVQHRNLVKLIGFCLEGRERLLVYELLNASLDQFIFGKGKFLDWKKRYTIIEGVSKGLLYLHEGSRLRIIHRDLKASNVLLDEKMNPKIGDFGLARMFTLNQTQGNTRHISGTYGYMPPEYVLHGQFSAKSDVYSFGVVMLELISGQKISKFRVGGMLDDLVGFAWRSWKDGAGKDIIDPALSTDSCIKIARCIHIGLLCVQHDETKRPTMSSVVQMLSNYSSEPLPLPSQPASFIGGNMTPKSRLFAEHSSRREDHQPCFNSVPGELSANLMSVSDLNQPR